MRYRDASPAAEKEKKKKKAFVPSNGGTSVRYVLRAAKRGRESNGAARPARLATARSGAEERRATARHLAPLPRARRPQFSVGRALPPCVNRVPLERAITSVL